MADVDFVDHVAGRLGGLPGVVAVALGGSRAQGTQRADSDWDMAIYYRGSFNPQTLRDIGWSGQVSEIGGWGGGVFNGGAWLQIDGRDLDMHYRDLDVVEHELAEAQVGRFRIEPLLFHLAGIPSYLVVAELALHRVLRGQLPRPAYPSALRRAAPGVWWARAEQTFAYARATHARYARLTQCVGLLAQATSQSAHAILAAGGEWVTNEKALVGRAGLGEVDDVIAAATAQPQSLQEVTDQTTALCDRAVRAATAD